MIKPKRAIHSRARAAALIEQIADKHRIGVNTMLCARWDRFAVLARAEAAHGLVEQLGWSLRAAGDYLGCSHENVRQLLACHKSTAPRIARLGAQVSDPDGRIRELEAELARLSGSFLCEKLSEQFAIPLRCGILLAILVEAYPRYVRGPAILQLYDDACERLGYGWGKGSNFNLMTKNAQHMHESLRSAGAPLASEVGDTPGSRRLTDAAAEWLHARCGAPRLSQIETRREAAMAV